MRVIASSFRAALIIAALFWGNCLTCPQALMAQAHRCCHKTHKDSTGCQTQVLHQFVKADQAAQHTAPVAVVTAEPAAIWTAPVSAVRDFRPVNPAQHAPPDLFSLHSSYRI